MTPEGERIFATSTRSLQKLGAPVQNWWRSRIPDDIMTTFVATVTVKPLGQLIYMCEFLINIGSQKIRILLGKELFFDVSKA